MKMLTVVWRKHAGKFLFLIGLLLGIGCTLLLDNWSLICLDGQHTTVSDFYNIQEEVPSNTTLDTTHPLSEPVRLACLVLTIKDNRKKAAMVNSTWGRRCHVVLFFSEEEDDSLPVVVLNITAGTKHLWGKVKKLFMHAHDHLINQVDWFVKADEDTYLVVENLHNLLRQFDHRKPHYIGAWFKNGNTKGYMSGGASYVLSSGALRIFSEEQHVKCRPGDEGREDVEMGNCMAALKVEFADTRDTQGRTTFFQYEPNFILDSEPLPKDHWLFTIPRFPFPRGQNCCSDRVISFHHVPPDWIQAIDYFIYTVKTHS